MVKPLDPTRMRLVSTEQVRPFSLPSLVEARSILAALYEELGAREPRNRRKIRGDLRQMLLIHRDASALQDQIMNSEDQRRWEADLMNLAAKLVETTRRSPLQFGFVAYLLRDDSARSDPAVEREEATRLIYRLEMLATRLHGIHKKGVSGRPRDWPFEELLQSAGRLYAAATGKSPRVSRHAETGKPSGPFFRVIQMICELAGETKTDAALATAIQRMNKNSPAAS